MKAFITSSNSKISRIHPGRMREALTEWRTLIQFDAATLLEVQLHTGRTHQIRIHFSAIKHPLVGDTLYGAAPQIRVGKMDLPALGRQFLHAAKLAFPHPRTGQWLEFRTALPSDLREFLDALAAAEGRSLEPAAKYL